MCSVSSVLELQYLFIKCYFTSKWHDYDTDKHLSGAMHDFHVIFVSKTYATINFANKT